MGTVGASCLSKKVNIPHQSSNDEHIYSNNKTIQANSSHSQIHHNFVFDQKYFNLVLFAKHELDLNDLGEDVTISNQQIFFNFRYWRSLQKSNLIQTLNSPRRVNNKNVNPLSNASNQTGFTTLKKCHYVDRQIWRNKGFSTFCYNMSIYVIKDSFSKYKMTELGKKQTFPNCISLQVLAQFSQVKYIFMPENHFEHYSKQLKKSINTKQFQNIDIGMIKGLIWINSESNKQKQYKNQLGSLIGNQIFGSILSNIQKSQSIKLFLFFPERQTHKQNHNIFIQGLKITNTYFQLCRLVGQTYETVFQKSFPLLQIPSTNKLFSVYFIFQIFKLSLYNKTSLKDSEQQTQSEEYKKSQIFKFINFDKQMWRKLAIILQIYFLIISQQNFVQSSFIQGFLNQAILEMITQGDLLSVALFVEFGLQIHSEELMNFDKRCQNLQFYSKPSSKTQQNKQKILIAHQVKVFYSPKIQSKDITNPKIHNGNGNININKLLQLLKTKKVSLATDLSLLYQKQNLIKRQITAILDQILVQQTLEKTIDNIKLVKEWYESSQYISFQTLVSYFSMKMFIIMFKYKDQLKQNSLLIQKLKRFVALIIYLINFHYRDPRKYKIKSNISIHKWEIFVLKHFLKQVSIQNVQTEFYQLVQHVVSSIQIQLISQVQKPSLKSQHKVRQKQALKHSPMNIQTGTFYSKTQLEEIFTQHQKSHISQMFSLSSKIPKIFQQKLQMSLQNIQGVLYWGNNKKIGPNLVPHLKKFDIIKINSGNFHFIFATPQGIYGFGNNSSHQLGNKIFHQAENKDQIIYELKALKLTKEDKIIVSCGNQHTAVLINSHLYMWGLKNNGIISGDGKKFDYICCGGLNTIALYKGIAYSWGRGEGGQLGHPVEQLQQQKKIQTTQYFVSNPKQIKFDRKITKVVCGDAHTIFLTEDFQVYVCGFSYQGQLGLGITGQSQNFQIFQPLRLKFKEKIVDIFAGPTFSFIKTINSDIYGFGLNDCEQLGIQKVNKIMIKKNKPQNKVKTQSQSQKNWRNKSKVGDEQFSIPTKIQLFGKLMNLQPKSISCGENHCLSIVKYGQHDQIIMGWGYNKNFQLGVEFSQITAPRSIDSLFGLKIKQLCCNTTCSYALIQGKQKKSHIKQFVKIILPNFMPTSSFSSNKK